MNPCGITNQAAYAYLITVMRKMYTIRIVALMLGVSACTDVKQTEEYQDLLSVKEQLETELHTQTQQNKEIIRFVTQIEDNLAAVREREMGIVNVKNEPGMNQSDRVTLIVAEIGTYFEENRSLLRKLEERVKSRDKKNADLLKLVDIQRRLIEEKEAQISTLLQTINQLNGQLENTVLVKNEEIEAHKQELYQVKDKLTRTEVRQATAYYRAGSRKELLKKGVITKEGGVLGMGKSVTVSSKLNPETFVPLDIRSTREIDLGDSDKQQLISVHPRNTYYFEKTSNGATYLKIKDPNQFWSISKYLVVVVD